MAVLGTDLASVLEDRGIEFRKGARDGEIWLCCPFCTEENESPDTRFRLGVNIQTGQMNCFNCHKRSRDAKYTFQELDRVLETGQLELAQKAKKPRVVEPVRLPEDFEILRKASDNNDYWGNVAYRFVRKRGVTDSQIKTHKIGYSVSGFYKYRIVIPVFYRGKLRGIVGRDFTGKADPKYKNSVGDRYLFNVPKEKSEGTVLVEGIFDALAVERGCGDLGLDAQGVLGHTLTDIQLRQLRGYKRVVIWPDPDAVGVKGALKMVKQVQEEVTENVALVVPKTGEDYDPSDHFPVEVNKRLRQAKQYSEELEQRMLLWAAFKEDEE